MDIQLADSKIKEIKEELNCLHEDLLFDLPLEKRREFDARWFSNTTKPNNGPNLQRMCIDTISLHVRRAGLEHLPIPRKFQKEIAEERKAFFV